MLIKAWEKLGTSRTPERPESLLNDVGAEPNGDVIGIQQLILFSVLSDWPTLSFIFSNFDHLQSVRDTEGNVHKSSPL